MHVFMLENITLLLVILKGKLETSYIYFFTLDPIVVL